MDSYKSVAGEKAYIGKISNGLASIVFYNVYLDPLPVIKKLTNFAGNFRFHDIRTVLLYRGKKYNENGSRSLICAYGIEITGVPAQNAISLPDWEE